MMTCILAGYYTIFCEIPKIVSGYACGLDRASEVGCDDSHYFSEFQRMSRRQRNMPRPHETIVYYPA